MLLCNESVRFLAKQDRWEEARAVLCKIRHLPTDHPYINAEFNEMVTAIENERILIGGSGFKDLMREMWTIPGNRKRALISVTLMICQQMTGTNVSSPSNSRSPNYTSLLTHTPGHQLIRPPHLREPGHQRPKHRVSCCSVAKCVSQLENYLEHCISIHLWLTKMCSRYAAILGL
jgi:hypothetical protein